MFGDFAVVGYTEVICIARVGRTRYGERGRGCWLVQGGKRGERLHKERLCWSSFQTFWEGWGTDVGD